MPISSPPVKSFPGYIGSLPGVVAQGCYLPDVPGAFKKCLSLTGHLPIIFAVIRSHTRRQVDLTEERGYKVLSPLFRITTISRHNLSPVFPELRYPQSPDKNRPSVPLFRSSDRKCLKSFLLPAPQAVKRGICQDFPTGFRNNRH